MDFITKLPQSDGCDTILTITDQGCTKMALFLPCMETITAEGIARIMCSNSLVYPQRLSAIGTRVLRPSSLKNYAGI